MAELLNETLRLQGVVRTIRVLQYVSNSRLGVTPQDVQNYLGDMGEHVCERTARRTCEVLVVLGLIRRMKPDRSKVKYCRGAFKVEFRSDDEIGTD